MSWTRYLETGSGKTRFRLAIEGLPYELVTDVDMERDLSGATTGRVAGLLRASLIGGEQVHPGTAELDQEAVNVRIVDETAVSSRVQHVLAYRPSRTTWLAAELSASATSITVKGTTGLSNGDVIHIGTEAIRIGTVASTTSLTGCTRALYGSIAQRHVIGDGALFAAPQVTNRPLCIEGRRAYLYAYGEGDSLTGNGSQIWLGVCQSDARLAPNGNEWSIQIAGIWQLTEQDLGADLAVPKSPRGIYYPAGDPLVIEINGARTFFTGFFETQADFLVALNAHLETNYGSSFVHANDKLEVNAAEDGGWYFAWTTTVPNDVFIYAHSPVDGVYDSTNGPLSDDAPTAFNYTLSTTQPNPIYRQGYSEGNPAGLGLVPRGSLGGDFNARRLRDDSSSYPDNRIYLDGDLTGVSATGTATVAGTKDNGEALDESLAYVDIDAADGWIEVRGNVARRSGGLTWTPRHPLTLRLTRVYEADGNLADFRDALVADAADNANTGTWPFVTSTDLDSWTDEVAKAAAGRRVVSHRRYAGSDACSLRDLLVHDMRLVGVYPTVTATGTIGVKALAAVAATEPSAGTLTAATTLVDTSPPSWERGPLGPINTVHIPTGYNPRTNKHEGDVHDVRDVGSYTLRKATRELEIKARSTYVDGDAAVSYADFVALCVPVLGIFGYDYAVVELEAPFHAWSYVLGTRITLTSHRLPDWRDGTRGFNAQPGTVIGRHWDMGAGRLRLRVLMSAQPIAGYTPTLTITGKAAGTDGTTGPFTLNWSTLDPLGTGSYLASGDVAINHWGTGTRATICEWDASSPVSRVGTISVFTQSTATTGTLTITFDSAWPGYGASLWTLKSPAASDTSLLAAQAAYNFIANANAEIDFGNTALTDINARAFSA